MNQLEQAVQGKKFFFSVITVFTFLIMLGSQLKLYQFTTIIPFFLLILYYICYFDKKVTLTGIEIGWLLLSFFCLISSFQSATLFDTVKFVISIWALVGCMILLRNNQGEWLGFLYKSLLFFSGVHLLASLIFTVDSGLTSQLNRLFYSGANLSYNLSLARNGYNVGISVDHGQNAFFLSVFMSLVFARFLIAKTSLQRLINLCLIMLGLFCLLTTAKRGLLLANVGAMLVSASLLFNTLRKTIAYLISLGVVGGMTYYVILQIPGTELMLTRFNYYRGGRLLNGRDILYEKIWDNIQGNFLLGSGVNSTGELTKGNDGHNLYLQIFSELGLVGLLLIVVLLFAGLILTCRLIRYFNHPNQAHLSANQLMYLSFSLYFQVFFIIYGFSGNPFHNFLILSVYILGLTISGFISSQQLSQHNQGNCINTLQEGKV